MIRDAGRATAGLGLVALGQLCYLLGAFQFGGRPLDMLLTLTSIVCAGGAALVLMRAPQPADAQGPLARWLTALAAAQLVDFAIGLGDGFGPFTLGFVLVVVGLGLAAGGAWARNAWLLRAGAIVAALGTLSYLVAGGVSLNVFTAGILATAIGWALVALA